jgi:hypothetical protein
MLVIGSNRIDWFFSRVFVYVTKVWCRVTKQTNVQLAYLLWGFAVGFISGYSYIEVTTKHFSLEWLTVLVRAGALTLVLLQLRHIRMHVNDRSIPPGVIPVPPACLLRLCKQRIWWMVVLAINVAIPPFPTSQSLPYVLGILAGAMSQYVVLHIDMGLPKKKSLWARAGAWLRDHAPSLGPVVAPSPA